MTKQNPKSKISNLNSFFGFTLIELLIVMAILGALASIVVLTFPAATERARDSNRKSDMSQYRTALETFANANNGFYPGFSNPIQPGIENAGANNDLCVDSMGLTADECPDDPKDNANNCEDGSGGDALCRYFYRSDGAVNNGSAVASRYVIYGRHERPTTQSREFWVACSTGRAGYTDTAPTGGSCPASLTQ